MKIVLICISFLFILSACSTTKRGLSQKEYQRSNAASEKALDRLDRE